MKSRLASIMFLSGVVMTTPAAAQDENLDQPVTAESVKVLHKYATCLASRREGEAREVLAIDYRDEDQPRKVRSLALRHHGCAPNGKLRMNRLVFVGGLAEALLEKDVGSSDLASRAAVDQARPLEARSESELMSLCTVRAAPAQVSALLATEAGSAEEKAAISTLMPAVGPCLKQGVAATLNAPGLRSLMALAAYRLIQHNQAPIGASGN